MTLCGEEDADLPATRETKAPGNDRELLAEEKKHSPSPWHHDLKRRRRERMRLARSNTASQLSPLYLRLDGSAAPSITLSSHIDQPRAAETVTINKARCGHGLLPWAFH